MSRLRPFRVSVRVVGAASLAALSLLVTSLTPLAARANAADQGGQSGGVVSTEELSSVAAASTVADVESSPELYESSTVSETSDKEAALSSLSSRVEDDRSLGDGDAVAGALWDGAARGVREASGGVGSISGFIYDDSDADWSTELDAEIAGVLVRLLDADGHAVRNASGDETATVTDNFGHYTFENLPMGSYKVQVVPGHATVRGDPRDLSTHVLTYAYGSSHSRDEAGKGQLVTPAPIVLTTASPNARDIDFGFVKPMSVGGRVYINENGNGVQDNDEPGVAGIKMSLRGKNVRVSAIHPDGSPVESVVTDAEGNYRFDNVLPGDISFVYELPEGFSVPYARDYFSDGTSERTVYAFEYKDYFQFHLGLAANGSIGDTVFWDVNRSGGSTPDEGDKLLSGVTVTLSYTTAGGVEKTQSTVTDSNGTYSFTGLAPGDYVVTVDESSLAAACPECNGQTHSPQGVLPAGDRQALALSAKVTLTSAAMLRSDQDWAFAVVPDEPGADDPVAPADPASEDPTLVVPEAPAVDGGGSAAQPSAPGNQTQVPSVNNGTALARTGSDASVLGGMAAMAAIAGIAALAGKRRRDRQDA